MFIKTVVPLGVALFGISLAAQAEGWPAPIKALEAQGMEIIGGFEAPGELTGYAALVKQQPVTLYLTVDGKYVIVGQLFDSKGGNLSDEPLDRLVGKHLAEKGWKLLASSTWIGDGDKDAPRVVYTFTDPNCPYCHKFWNAARPWVNAGKVQLRHVMVGILGPTSPGKAAALLSAKDPQAALTQHELQRAGGGIKPLSTIPAEIRAQLDANQKLMERMGASVTPTIFYRDAGGMLKMTQGAPSEEKLNDILGPL